MKRRASVALVLGFSLVSASDKPWPGNGDIVYLSASIKNVENPKLVSGASMKYNMPPCKALTISKADPEKLSWVTEDPLGSSQHLEGPWSGWMHKTETECKTQFATRGEPRVGQSGTTYRLLEAKAAPKAGEPK